MHLSHINKIRDLCTDGEKEAVSSSQNATRAVRAERLLMAEQKKNGELKKRIHVSSLFHFVIFQLASYMTC